MCRLPPRSVRPDPGSAVAVVRGHGCAGSWCRCLLGGHAGRHPRRHPRREDLQRDELQPGGPQRRLLDRQRLGRADSGGRNSGRCDVPHRYRIYDGGLGRRRGDGGHRRHRARSPAGISAGTRPAFKSFGVTLGGNLCLLHLLTSLVQTFRFTHRRRPSADCPPRRQEDLCSEPCVRSERAAAVAAAATDMSAPHAPRWRPPWSRSRPRHC